MTNFEKIYNLIRKKKLFIFLKYFFIVLVITSFIFINSLQLIYLIHIFSNFKKVLEYIEVSKFGIISLIEIFLFMIISILSFISLFWHTDKSKIFLSIFTALICICIIQSLVIQIIEREGLKRFWEDFQFISYFLPALILGWFYKPIRHIIDKQIETVNSEIDNMSNSSQQ